ncbi:MAG: dihydrofolate reductase family protein [Cetobacterium sp.]
MRKVILYIAMSLDGYIADRDGGVDWIEGDSSEIQNPGTYFTFLENIDTVILGSKTYHQVITELSPNDWPYKDLNSYVLTTKKEKDTENIKFIDENLEVLIQNLKNSEGKDIWICGGATVVNQLINLDLIDNYQIIIIPKLLGDGIRLFEKFDSEKKLTLVSTQSYNGIVEINYKKN